MPMRPRYPTRGTPRLRINGKIRAREVRVIAEDGQQVGVCSLGEAIQLARASGVDLVEVAPNASPPVCRIVDYGRYVYEQNKREKESKKHHHASKIKEVQLSASIDHHDFGIKVSHAIEFLCDEMKVKASLRFRGREMAHKEFGFQVVQRFIEAVAAYGQPDAQPKLMGRNVNVMFSPLPRNKRAKDPRQLAGTEGATAEIPPLPSAGPVATVVTPPVTTPASPPAAPADGFSNNPFQEL
jgi:translation initiation factor IF-3